MKALIIKTIQFVICLLTVMFTYNTDNELTCFIFTLLALLVFVDIMQYSKRIANEKRKSLFYF